MGSPTLLLPRPFLSITKERQSSNAAERKLVKTQGLPWVGITSYSTCMAALAVSIANNVLGGRNINTAWINLYESNVVVVNNQSAISKIFYCYVIGCSQQQHSFRTYFSRLRIKYKQEVKPTQSSPSACKPGGKSQGRITFKGLFDIPLIKTLCPCSPRPKGAAAAASGDGGAVPGCGDRSDPT